MRRFIVVVVLLVLGAAPALAQEPVAVEVGDLLNDATAYEGPVVVVGELIGDFGFRSDGSVWTQLNGDSYAQNPILDGGALTGGNIGVAVRIPDSAATTRGPPGGYRVRGPIVAVTGIWKYHDPDRAGESYIDVSSLVVVDQGHGLPEHPNYWIMGSGLVLIGAAVVLRRPRSRRRR